MLLVSQVTRDKLEVPVTREFNVKQVTWASLVHQHQLGCRVNLEILVNVDKPAR